MKKLIAMIKDEADKETGLGIAWTACFIIFIVLTLFAIIWFLVWLAFTYPTILYLYAMVPLTLLGILVDKTYEKYSKLK